MRTDTIKAWTSALVALIVVAGGLAEVYALTAAGTISGDAALAILGPLIGGAAAWVFGQDARTGGARAAERAVALGVGAATGNAPIPPGS